MHLGDDEECVPKDEETDMAMSRAENNSVPKDDELLDIDFDIKDFSTVSLSDSQEGIGKTRDNRKIMDATTHLSNKRLGGVKVNKLPGGANFVRKTTAGKQIKLKVG